MDGTWRYLVNQFVNSTENSYRKSMKLSNYHDANLKLQKDIYAPLIPLYTRYHPLHLELVEKYTKWYSEVGYREGRTINIMELLEETYENLFLWDLDIQGVYNAKTSEYKGFFAEGRAVFYKGTLESRINAYNTLQDRLGTNPSLATVKQDILDAYTALNDARDVQIGSKGNVKLKSGSLDIARINAMNMQYRNLGICMDAFIDEPMITESLFDVNTMRTAKQTVFNGTIPVNDKNVVFTRTLLADDQIVLRNTGAVDITFYYSNIKGGTNSTPIGVHPMSETKVEMSAFNVPDYGTYRHLTAVNSDLNIEATYTVKLV